MQISTGELTKDLSVDMLQFEQPDATRTNLTTSSAAGTLQDLLDGRDHGYFPQWATILSRKPTIALLYTVDMHNLRHRL